MATEKSSAPAHPPIEDHDDTVEAHYSCLERPHACLGGWVFVGYIDEYGEEREALTAAAAATVKPGEPRSERPVVAGYALFILHSLWIGARPRTSGRWA